MLARVSHFPVHMPDTKSIADVIGTGAGVQPHEAVAILQLLMTSGEGDVELRAQGPPSLGDVCLRSDGSVVCRGAAMPATVPDMAKLFEAILPRGGETRVSGALRYTVARALHEVDAPTFTTIADFSAALKPHEKGDRMVVLRELYARTPAVDPPVAVVPDEARRPVASTSALPARVREPVLPPYLRLISERPVESVPATVQPTIDPIESVPVRVQLAIDPAEVELIPEPRLEPSIEGAGFKARRWVLGGAAAAVMSFAAGYIVVDRMTSRVAGSPVAGSPSPGAVTDATAGLRAETDAAHDIRPNAADPADVERNGQVRSVYTPLSGTSCTTTKEDLRTGSFHRVCPGVAGSRLVIAFEDERMSVTVVTQDGREHPLNYSDVIAPAVSSLGAQAEWRIISRDGKVTPVALIVRVFAEGNDSRAPRKTSYLTVAKFTSTEICVTDRIPAAARANERARRAAFLAAARACLKPV